MFLPHIQKITHHVFQALCFYNLSGASIDPPTLKHVAKVCASVELSDHVVEVIFTIFDEDGDGQLSNKVEFVNKQINIYNYFKMFYMYSNISGYRQMSLKQNKFITHASF